MVPAQVAQCIPLIRNVVVVLCCSACSPPSRNTFLQTAEQKYAVFPFLTALSAFFRSTSMPQTGSFAITKWWDVGI